LIKSILGEDRYSFLEVLNGLDAVEAFGRDDLDLVILDVDMPLLDGFGAISEIRKIKKEFSVPIILVTAKGGDSDAFAEGLRSGADDYITKPFKTEELRARVEAFIRLSNSQREQIKQSTELTQYRLLGQVVITLSHYINNAVNSISLYCQTTRPEDVEKVREMTRVTIEHIDRIHAVVKSLQEIAEKTTDLRTEAYPGGLEIIKLAIEKHLGRIKK
jgi:CheY-like chemotaxis protein